MKHICRVALACVFLLAAPAGAQDGGSDDSGLTGAYPPASGSSARQYPAGVDLSRSGRRQAIIEQMSGRRATNEMTRMVRSRRANEESARAAKAAREAGAAPSRTLPAARASGEQAERVRAAFARARNLEASGNRIGAQDVLRPLETSILRLSAADPDNAEWLYMLGYYHLKVGMPRYQSALGYFQKAALAGGGNPLYRQQAGQMVAAVNGLIAGRNERLRQFERVRTVHGSAPGSGGPAVPDSPAAKTAEDRAREAGDLSSLHRLQQGNATDADRYKYGY